MEKKTTKQKSNTYHIKKRPEDGKWEVRLSGGAKAIKLFDTKEQATEYTIKMAGNQEKAIVFHKSKGPNKGKFSKK